MIHKVTLAVITIFKLVHPYDCPDLILQVIKFQVRTGRPSVPKLKNQATITAGGVRGLSEWIIDDSCLVDHLGRPTYGR